MDSISFLISLFLLVTHSHLILCSDQQNNDVAALISFKQSSVAADPNHLLTNWVSTAATPCSFHGVTCSPHHHLGRRITALNLTNFGLIGRLHLDPLTTLPTLTHLLFSHNSFSGNLSTTTSPPSSSCNLLVLDLSSNNVSDLLAASSLLRSCNSLASLDLSHNQISDSSILKYSLSNCLNLNSLNLSYNKISGNLDLSSTGPSSPSLLCTNFSILDLSNNLLSGEIPDLPQSLSVLDLSNNNFSGNFSSVQFGTCLNLIKLNLSHNSLSGTGFPASLANCHLLTMLDIGYNAVRGKIPGVLFSNLKNLRELYLARNRLFGEIPQELGETCGTLEVLDLSRNYLTGGIPSNFARCSSLISLNLGHNQLSGDFLSTVISTLRSLKYLSVQFNNITGPVPLSLINSTWLRVLDLSSNSFTGNVPSGFCSSTSSVLEKLLLSDNYLSGSVPSELGNCKNLRTIDLSFNNLVGEIPIEIWNLPNLLDLVMWANNLTGNIPEGICINGGNLQTLILNNNLITGSLPLSIANCTNLIWVSLSSNRLAGEIPSGIGNLRNLAVLQLGNNSLTGEIPREFGNCQSLIWLDLNSNGLTGPIPPELANNAGLVLPGIVSGKQFVFVRNEGGTACRGAGGLVEFEGIRAERLENFPMVHSCPSTRIYSGMAVYTFESNGSMIYLDLSYNSLFGTIPEKFGSMKYLQVLNLGHNNLSGTIPFSLGGLKVVGVLDLSHNNLQGYIPGSLGDLSFLSDFDVSNNELIGTIPSGGQLTTFPASRYENNSGLCGVPLPPCGSGNEPRRRPAFRRRGILKQAVTAEMVIGIGVSVFCIVMLVLAFCRIKKHQQKTEKRGKYIESLTTSGSSSWKLSGVPEPLSINVAAFEKPLKKLTFAHLLEATNGFSADSLIGSGGFGEVYKAQLRDGCVVAIKKLIHVTGQGDREFMAEMETIGKIKHRNLVPLLGYCKIGEERLLVYEYMKWGSLEFVLHDSSKVGGLKLDWAARKKIAIGSARGLSFLHHSCIPHIIHRDMKSSNVLLDDNFEARVSDFGMARLVNALDTHLSVSTLAGTPGYVPPEYYQSFRCTAKGDVYSFGVVLLELISGKRPIDTSQFGDDNNLVGWAKQKQKEKRIHEILDNELISHESADEAELLHCLRIAFACLDDRPFRRPTMIQVMTMFKDLGGESESDTLDSISLKNTAIDEQQEKEP
ncbi:hypothetical protein ACSBR2_010981 [Camellia fascicularis]